MSFLGNVMKSVINPATLLQVAMGPAGWASIAVRAIGTAIAQQVIQQLGQKLGLPQGIIDTAQQAFSAATGQPGGAVKSIAQTVGEIGAQVGMSLVEQARTEREANNSVSNLMNFAPSKTPEDEEGGSFLVAIAKAMGKQMDKRMGQMKTLSDEIGALSNQETKQGSKEANQLGTKNNLLQAYSQELGIMSNAFANVVKSAGEAQTTAARKG